MSDSTFDEAALRADIAKIDRRVRALSQELATLRAARREAETRLRAVIDD